MKETELSIQSKDLSNVFELLLLSIAKLNHDYGQGRGGGIGGSYKIYVIMIFEYYLQSSQTKSNCNTHLVVLVS